jgi:transposase
VEHAAARIERLERAIDQVVVSAPAAMKAIIEALQSLRGIAKVSAVTIACGVGGSSRFQKATRLMAYAGVMAREHSSGERVGGNVPRNRGDVTTMIGALEVHGVRATMTIEGGTDAEVFETFLEQVLVRRLRPGDIVVLDNLGAHESVDARRVIEGAGARLVYLPPCPLDLNPIELCWSKLKAALKDFGARAREAWETAIRRAMDLIVPEDAAGWFEHRGEEAHAD